jgi:hypothetical protein
MQGLDSATFEVPSSQPAGTHPLTHCAAAMGEPSAGEHVKHAPAGTSGPAAPVPAAAQLSAAHRQQIVMEVRQPVAPALDPDVCISQSLGVRSLAFMAHAFQTSARTSASAVS